MSSKEQSDLWVFIVSAINAVYLAFIPYIVDRKLLDLRSCVLVAAGLTVVALIWFFIGQRAAAREQSRAAERERGRDKMLKEILESQKKVLSHTEEDEKRRAVIELAASMYESLLDSDRESLTGRVLERLLSATLNKAYNLFGMELYRIGADLGLELIRDVLGRSDRTIKQIQLRETADKLAAVALGVSPEQVQGERFNSFRSEVLDQ